MAFPYSPEDFEHAYRKTGRRVLVGDWFRKADNCGCPISTLAEASDPAAFAAAVESAGFGYNLARLVDLYTDQVLGFIDGFDGSDRSLMAGDEQNEAFTAGIATRIHLQTAGLEMVYTEFSAMVLPEDLADAQIVES